MVAADLVHRRVQQGGVALEGLELGGEKGRARLSGPVGCWDRLVRGMPPS